MGGAGPSGPAPLVLKPVHQIISRAGANTRLSIASTDNGPMKVASNVPIAVAERAIHVEILCAVK
jgi:hypothetical protein